MPIIFQSAIPTNENSVGPEQLAASQLHSVYTITHSHDDTYEIERNRIVFRENRYTLVASTGVPVYLAPPGQLAPSLSCPQDNLPSGGQAVPGGKINWDTALPHTLKFDLFSSSVKVTKT